MAAPYVSGANVAHTIRFVQSTLGWRGLRAPTSEVGGMWVCAQVLIDHIESRQLVRRKLSEVALSVAALADYYESIGARSDAHRWTDTLHLVQVVAERRALNDSILVSRPVGSGGAPVPHNKRYPMSDESWAPYAAAFAMPTRTERVEALAALIFRGPNV